MTPAERHAIHTLTREFRQRASTAKQFLKQPPRPTTAPQFFNHQTTKGFERRTVMTVAADNNDAADSLERMLEEIDAK